MSVKLTTATVCRPTVTIGRELPKFEPEIVIMAGVVE
jgi:hypothetical protein